MTRATRLAYPVNSISDRSAEGFHDLLLPGFGGHLDLKPAVPGREQELAPVRTFQALALGVAELEGPLQLLGLPRSLRPEKAQRRVGGDHQPGLAPQQVARVLGREDERAIVLADPAGEPDHEAADHRGLEQQAQLVDDEKPSPGAIAESPPERLGEEEVN